MTAGATVPAVARAAAARDQLRQLTGLETEAISGMNRVDGGWEFEVDVVEVRRVPDTATLLATYRVSVDDVGDVTGYARVRRFIRGDAG